MYKEIEITTNDGGVISLPLKSTASTIFRFKQFTGKELIDSIANIMTTISDQDLGMAGNSLTQLTEEVSRLAFIMNKQATAKNSGDLSNLNEYEYIDWLDQFDPMAFIEKISDILEVYMQGARGTSVAKKNPAQLNEE